MGWRHELDRLEQALHRERKGERAKTARGTDSVLAEIREQLDQQAQNLGLSPQAYRNLLENPESYRKFLELTNGRGFNTTKTTDNSELARPKRTTLKSRRGTVFDTTDWDPLFNKKVRDKIEEDL